jgi:MoxR-like ATPase
MRSIPATGDLIHYHFSMIRLKTVETPSLGWISPDGLVRIFHSAARRATARNAVILLHGPVGTAKSTIVRLLKKGMEAYTRTEEGRLYTFLLDG